MSKNGKTLFAGPFVGELGWELFGWQSYLRKLAEGFDNVIISSRPDREYLYSDFCTRFVPNVPMSENCAGWTCFGYSYRGGLHEKYNPDYFLYFDKDEVGSRFIKGKEQKFFKYGNKLPERKYDLAIHARNITDRQGFGNKRNWDIKRWESLIKDINEKGYKIASIGTKKHAAHIKGTSDCRNLNLEDLADVLSNSIMIIGPSSGPMHFATLCGCPQLVWTSNKAGIGKGNLEKYKKNWNPFNTKTRVYFEEGWHPSHKSILREFDCFINELD